MQRFPNDAPVELPRLLADRAAEWDHLAITQEDAIRVEQSTTEQSESSE